MRNLTASVLNINEARLSAKDWAVQLIVVASPSSCWLVRREAQQEVGLFSGVEFGALTTFWICCDDE